MVRAGGARRPAEGGFTLVEVAVAVTLATGLLLALGVTAATLRKTLDGVARDIEEVDAARVARALLDHVAGEGGIVGPGPGSSELTVDLPIGHAEACDTLWRWRGLRRPVAGRDSAVVVEGAGRLRRVAVLNVRSESCAGSEALGIATAPPAEDAVRMVVFERGVVRVDAAVRYARWGTPRQPLSAATLDPSRSDLVWDSAADLPLGLRLARDPGRMWRRRW